MRNNVSPKTLNILKASLPFVPPPMQRNLSYFIKIEEFNNMFNDFSSSLDSTISACEINNNENTPFNPADLLQAIKPYLDKNERDMINMFMNIMTALNLYKSAGNNPNSLLGNLLSQANNSGNANNSNQTFNNILNSGLLGGINPSMFNHMTSNPSNGNQETNSNNMNNIQNLLNNMGVNHTNNNDSNHTTANTYNETNDSSPDDNSQIIENANSNSDNQIDASIEALQRLITNNTGNQN